jgi:hypothetical protein
MKHCLLPAPFLATLAILTACEKQEGQPTFYAPTAVGTTLQFETLKPDNGTWPNDRLQLRVLQARQTDDGLEVTYDYSTLQRNAKATFLCQQNGGIFQVKADGSKDMQLPPGFPDSATSWQRNRVTFKVLGRAKANLEGIELYDPIGVWVEARAESPQPQGKARILFLPSIGEAETKVLQEGNWVTVNRLVGIGASAEPM